MPEPFHPDLRAARFLPRAAVGPRSLRLVRAATRLGAAAARSKAEVVAVSEAVSVRVFRPAVAAAPTPALLWIHGGGLVMGHAAMDDDFCRRAARELGAVVASVEYRLAPEHPFPTPLHDCYAALEWLAERPDVDARRIAVGGASAGGGLAAALALLARERDAIHLAFQLLVYPMLDDRTVRAADGTADRLRMWNAASNRFGWRCYLGAPDGEVPPLAAPARAPDLTGLPPAWIGVGTLDLFRDEDREYALRLREAGVAVELHEVPGAYHGFDMVQRRAPVSREFVGAQLAAVDAALQS
ncbi:alpha/beta hydrolase [Pseudonocardia lacus]|uniref:alpha/beta hydrolase n=1 Tax=Pseudonocardia lacus TaxID=2835865 RepID=UPI001BDC72C1|nr:alpha/beta hydrolase [Pseudonocardia lacus]